MQATIDSTPRMKTTKIKKKAATEQKKPKDKFEKRVHAELMRQQSLAQRVEKVQQKALNESIANGYGDSPETRANIQQKINDYMSLELVRKAVKDVKKRGQEQNQKRLMKERAYSAVKSKVGRNIKVIEKVKKTGSPVKPAAGYDPNFRIEETLRKTKTKGRPRSSYTVPDLGDGPAPRIGKDHIEIDNRFQ